MKKRSGSLPACPTALLLLAVMAGPTQAGEAESPWADAHKSQVRLISAGERHVRGQKVLLAGVQLEMAPGWKTYWRFPGDSGLPPSFEWSGSENLKRASVLWPGPERSVDSSGTSIVYHDEVVFPVMVEPADPGEPVKLALEFEFAICKDICVPADAKLALELDTGSRNETSNGKLLRRYLAQVPRKPEVGVPGPSISSISVSLEQPDPSITIDAKFPPDAKKTDLFVEGPPGAYVPLPERVSEKPGGDVRFRVDLAKGDDPAQLKGKMLTITLISPNANREIRHRVD